MELIPYTSREGREIVLRHRNALVVRDPLSQRLEIRGATLTECPTCNQPWPGRTSSPDRNFDGSAHESYVDPNYFRMLQAGYDEDEGNEHIPQRQAPSSPVRRLTQPALPDGETGPPDEPPDADNAEFISSTPAPQEGGRIRRDAFSPHYFNRFFVEERELGRGGKGVVLLVRHEIDGCPLGHFACKRVPVGDDHAWLEKVLIEVELLAKLSHPNLVSYRHVWLEDVKLHRFGPSNVACAFILQQYCNSGDLLQYIVGDQPKQTTKEQLKAQMRRRSQGRTERPGGVSANYRRLPFEEIYPLFKDVTSGLAYLHSANYIHRDLKPSNCLLHHENGKSTCLISDFGEVQPGNAVRNSTGTTGTISYCAPEVLKMDELGRFGNFTTKSDVFSLGMILYFLCFGRLPYRNANVVQEELEDIDLLRAEITDWKGFQDERRERPDLPVQLYQLLKKMLALNPADRPTAIEVLNAMNHEQNHGGMRSAARSASPPIGLHHRRVQNLDSPMPPSTPVPEPQKQRYGNHLAAEDTAMLNDNAIAPLTEQSLKPRLDNSLQKYAHPNPPRHRPLAMTLSRSPDRPSHRSPDQAHATGISHPPPPTPGAQTPLLMPPPAGLLWPVRHHAMLAQHHLTDLAQNHGDSVSWVFRFALFLVKIASLAKACWPFMVSLRIGLPLVCVAGLDLSVPTDEERHALNDEARPRIARATRLVRLSWGWKLSVLLLVFHFLTLSAVSRWGPLCAIPHDQWLGW
ncbi:protein kinase-like protein [Xylariomycetidae sp. FL0641]|nr:protein kinase-like protein [Xylariomycetidae sp. FL0641]